MGWDGWDGWDGSSKSTYGTSKKRKTYHRYNPWFHQSFHPGQAGRQEKNRIDWLSDLKKAFHNVNLEKRDETTKANHSNSKEESALVLYALLAFLYYLKTSEMIKYDLVGEEQYRLLCCQLRCSSHEQRFHPRLPASLKMIRETSWHF